jgi:hypothetical protein
MLNTDSLVGMPVVIMDTLDGVPIKIIGLEQLKINKKASGRHKDLSDLEHLP